MRKLTRPEPGAVPDGPGVYQFLGADDRVLYVGKAKHLSARVQSYFRETGLHDRTRRMLQEAVDVRWTTCSSELEALILEASWIKKLQPPYNVALKDSSPYPRLAVTVRDDVPRLLPWRSERKGGIRYFGPYPRLRMRALMDTVTRVFPVRSCNESVYRRAQLAQRPCMLADLGRCAAPCVGRVSVEEHRSLVDDLLAFLSGGSAESVRRTESAMLEAAQYQQFELAARLRDRLAVLTAIGVGQAAALSTRLSADVFTTAGDGTRAAFGWARIRRGEVLRAGCEPYEPDPTVDPARALSQLITGFYLAGEDDLPTPSEIIVAVAVEDPVAALVGEGVRMRVPRRGDGLAALGFAQRQADEGVRQLALRREDGLEDRHGALDELGAALGVLGPIRRIEALDNSHTQGRDTIGGLVTFVDGREVRAEHRRLNLVVDTGDDYAAMAELVTRRFSGNQLGLSSPPDLLLIDGGPAQVNAVAKALDALGPALLRRPHICGLAKRLEELYLEGEADPILLPRSSSAFLLVTRMRDAVHDNAIGAHRRRRDRVRSTMDDLEGIGPVRQAALLARFGSLAAVRAASLTDLQTTPGFGPRIATQLHRHLHPELHPETLPEPQVGLPGDPQVDQYDNPADGQPVD